MAVHEITFIANQDSPSADIVALVDVDRNRRELSIAARSRSRRPGHVRDENADAPAAQQFFLKKCAFLASHFRASAGPPEGHRPPLRSGPQGARKTFSGRSVRSLGNSCARDLPA